MHSILKPTSKRRLIFWLIIAIGVVLWCIAFYKAYRFLKSLSLPSTEAVLGALGAAGMNWEIWTLRNRKNGDSFSAVIKKLGKGQPFIPHSMGMLNSHLWSDDPATLEAYLAGFEAGKKYWPLLDKEDLEEAKATS